MNHSASLSKKETSHAIWILSIDGGGIRGIIPAHILSYLETQIKNILRKELLEIIEQSLGPCLSPKPVLFFETPLAKMFDLMAGTSVGGLLTLGLNVPYPKDLDIAAYNAEKLIDFFRDRDAWVKNRSFLGKLLHHKFHSQGLENLLHKYFKEFFLKESLGNIILTAYEIREERLRIFDSYRAKVSPTYDFYMYDVVRAISAAPSYFEAAEVKNQSLESSLFVDGGIVCNNPSIIALFRAQAIFPNARRINLVSLGTGRSDQGNLSKLRKKGILGWGRKISSIIIDGVSDLNDRLIKEFDNIQSGRMNYIRIQPTITKNREKLDNTDEDNIQYLHAIANKTIDAHLSTLNDISENLAKAYKQKGFLLRPDIKSTKEFNRELENLKKMLNTKKINKEEAWNKIIRYINEIALNAPKKGKHKSTKQNPFKFSKREIQILSFLNKHLTSKEVARELDLSPRTVDYCLRNIMIKTQCTRRAELVRLFRSHYKK